MVTKGFIFRVAILTLLFIRMNYVYGDIAVFKVKKNVCFENSTIKGLIDHRGFIASGSAKTLPGALAAIVRNEKGVGIGGTRFDGHVSGFPRVLFSEPELQTKVLESGPIRAVIVMRMSGAGKVKMGFAPETKLTVERKFIICANSERIVTVARYETDKHFAPLFSRYSFPNPNLGMRVPPTKKPMDSFKYVMSGDIQGDVVMKNPGEWLNKPVPPEGAWIQFFLPSQESENMGICLGYLLPGKGKALGNNVTHGTGENAFVFCEFAYQNNYRANKDGYNKNKKFSLPITYILSDKVKYETMDEYVTEYYAKRYFPDGTPRGLKVDIKWLNQDVRGEKKKTGIITISEELGLNRKNEVFEVLVGVEGDELNNADLYYETLVAKAGSKNDLGFQLKNNDPGTKTIVFQVPEIKAKAITKVYFIPGGVKK